MTTSVTENKYNIELVNIYPNPATDKIQVISKQYSINSIKIYNLLGENIYSSPITDNFSPITINVSTFPRGIYLVKLVTNGTGLLKNEKGMVVKKFIKE